MRRKPAACSKVLGPRPATSSSCARRERAVGVAPAHDGAGHGLAQARHARQQRRRRGVEVDADLVHAVLDDGVQRLGQLALVDVVLVLADADALGVDLHQLGQRILQAARDGDGAAQAHVQVGQLLAGELGGRVHRGAGLADDDLVDLHVRRELLHALDQVAGELVRLAARGAVADGDQVDPVLRHQAAQRVQRAFPVAARLVRVDGVRGQHLAGVGDDGHLHAGADAGVQAHHDALAGGCGQQQVAQVLGEHADRDLLGLLAHAAEQVALQAQRQLDLPRPRHRALDQIVARALAVGPAQVARDAAFGQARLAGDEFLVEHELGVQHLLRAAAEHGQRAMRGHRADRLGVVEVVAELGDVGVVLVLAVHLLRLQDTLRPQPLAQRAHQRGVLGPALGQQVAHAVEHRERIGETGIGVDEGGGLGVRIQRRVGEQLVGQRLEAGLAGDHALGAALLLERQVEVFQLLLGRRGGDGLGQRGRELALLVDALEHRGAAVFQLAQVGQTRLELAQLRVVEVVGDFLAIAGDERHRRATVQQRHRRVDLCGADLQFRRDLKKDLFQNSLPVWRREAREFAIAR